MEENFLVPNEKTALLLFDLILNTNIRLRVIEDFICTDFSSRTEYEKKDFKDIFNAQFRERRKDLFAEIRAKYSNDIDDLLKEILK